MKQTFERKIEMCRCTKREIEATFATRNTDNSLSANYQVTISCFLNKPKATVPVGCSLIFDKFP